MAFDLSKIPAAKKIKSTLGQEKQKAISASFSVIKKIYLLSDNVRLALEVNLTERLKTLSTTNLDPQVYKENIVELLEFCCKKKYLNISSKDVKDNEASILQQIKWCTEYKNTKRLIFNEEEYAPLEIAQNKSKSRITTAISTDELMSYFKMK